MNLIRTYQMEIHTCYTKKDLHTRTRWRKHTQNSSINVSVYMCVVVLGGLVVSVLATGPKVRGFNPGRGRWIFKGDNNPVGGGGK
jgi:hypothetical protein